MNIQYAVETNLTSQEFINLLRRSTLAERRPVDEPATISGMLRGATIIITARCEGELVGVSRAISDRAYCTYLSDLAVDKQYQRQGIGRKLIDLTHRTAGLETTLILLAAPQAVDYYPHIGMQPHSSCWIVTRSSQPTPVSREESEEVNRLLFDEAEPGVARFFDAMVADYDQAIHRCFPRYSEMLWALLEYLPASTTDSPRILELGCGTGNLSILIAQKFPDASFTFIDLSSQSLEQCRARLPGSLKGTWTCTDMRDASFPVESFDYILSSIAIHHLSSQEKQALFANCFRWLTKDGVLAFSDQFSAATQEIYDRHLANWKRVSIDAGSNLEEWQVWMEHQRLHDHHDSLPDQIKWLEEAGFDRIDSSWRYLLWTVLQARKPSS